MFIRNRAVLALCLLSWRAFASPADPDATVPPPAPFHSLVPFHLSINAQADVATSDDATLPAAGPRLEEKPHHSAHEHHRHATHEDQKP